MEKTPNWMKYAPMFSFYKQSQAAGEDLEPDTKFLSDPSLGRYSEYQLKGLELPEKIKNFLMEVGLPDKFDDWRSPGEEKDSQRDTYTGVIFGVSILNNREIDGKKYLMIGERCSLGRSCVITNSGKPDETKCWNKLEDRVYTAVELETGMVWKWIPKLSDKEEDIFTFINSSLEQYLLSMAYWRAFYPKFAGQVREYTAENPDDTEIDFIFDHD